MSLWDEVKKNVVDIYSVTTDKTAEMAKVGSRRWDKFGISRDIERQFSELGNLVYTGLQEGREEILDDPAVAVLMTRIGALELELNKKEEEIEDIHREHQEKKKAEAAAGGSTAGPADQEDLEAEVIIKDPVLEEGTTESAILVEPAVEVEIDVETLEEDGPEETKDS